MARFSSALLITLDLADLTPAVPACGDDAPTTCTNNPDEIVACETCNSCSATSLNENCRPTSTMGQGQKALTGLIQCADVIERAWRPLMKWEIETASGTVTFSTWGHPTSIEWIGQGWFLVVDEEGSYWVKFEVQPTEPTPPVKRAAIRRGRMEAMGEADRRASRPQPDNSWKRHRSTQWR